VHAYGYILCMDDWQHAIFKDILYSASATVFCDNVTLISIFQY